jgi:hypothetical protein
MYGLIEDRAMSGTKSESLALALATELGSQIVQQTKIWEPGRPLLEIWS